MNAAIADDNDTEEADNEPSVAVRAHRFAELKQALKNENGNDPKVLLQSIVVDKLAECQEIMQAGFKESLDEQRKMYNIVFSFFKDFKNSLVMRAINV